MKKFWTVVGILVFCAGLGWGQTYVWVGGLPHGGDGITWEDPDNWEDAAMPGVAASNYPGQTTAGDSAQINTNVVTITTPIQLLASLDIVSGTLVLETPLLSVIGNITQSGGTINTSGGTLTSTGGSVTQSGGTINGTGLTVNAVTGITLTGANTITGTFAAMASSGGVSLTNTGALEIQGITAATNNDITVNNTGNVNITTSQISTGAGTGNIGITATTGTLTVGAAVNAGSGTVGLTTTGSNALAINADITTTGTVDLDSGGAITGSAGIKTATAVTADSATGVTLGGANTIAGTFAATATSGGVSLTNTGALEIQGITAATNNDITVNNTGNVNITTSPVSTGSGTIDLKATGAVTQTAAGNITTTGTLILGGGGSFALDTATANDVGTLATSVPSPTTISYTDTNGFNTGNLSAATVNLSAGAAVGQNSSTAITVTNLNLGGSGVDYTLTNSGNNVGTLATIASNDPKSINFTDTNALTIADVTITPGETFTVTAGDAITVTGRIAVTGASTSTAGTVILESAHDTDITFNSTSQVVGINHLSLKAGSASNSDGDVTISTGSFSVNDGSNTEDIHIWADTVTWTVPGTTTPGQLHVWVDESPVGFGYANATGGKVIHPRTLGHVVYSPTAPTGLLSGAFWVNSNTPLGSPVILYTENNFNIYFIDVGDSSPANTRAVTATIGGTPTGFIEIRGNYTSSGALTLNPGSGGVRLADGGAPAAVTLNSVFSTNGTKLTLAGNASITAAGITLGDNVYRDAAAAPDLTLVPKTGALSVTGTVGENTGTGRLGDITVTTFDSGTVTFSNTVYAASYTQTETGTSSGLTTFSAAQNYNGVNGVYAFQFTGSALTMAGLTTTAANGPVGINNTAAFTQSSGTITSSGTFNQAGAGTVSLNGSIITNNGSAANENITFTGAVTLAGATTITSNTGGNIVFNSTINGYNTLTLNNSAGKVEFKDAVGATTRLGAIARNGTGDTDIYANVFTNNANMVFAGNVNLLGNVHFDSNTSAGNIRINGSIDGNDGTARNLTFTAGTGHIYVGGDTGSSTLGRTGAITINSASNVKFGSSTSNVVYAASFLQSAGTGATVAVPWTVSGTEFTAAQNYSDDFSFTGAALTVNNTLVTDTDTSGDGPILITNASNNVNFTVGSSGSIAPGGTGGTITVNGVTTNNGAITAAPISAAVAITFRGNYTADVTSPNVGSLTGSSAVNKDIQFGGNVVLGALSQGDDRLVFYTGGSSGHNLSLASVASPVLNNVLIDDGNTVTVLSGTTITQANDSNLTLNDGAVLDLNHSTLGPGTWKMGTATGWLMGTAPDSNPSGEITTPLIAFTTGFAGLSGNLVFVGSSELKTTDFYTRKNTTAPDSHTVTLPTGMATITAAGNVVINETFSGDLLKSTLTMTGGGEHLVLRANPSLTSRPRAVVELGNFTAKAGGPNGTIINSDIIVRGNVTFDGSSVLTAGLLPASNWHIQVFGNWIQASSGLTGIPSGSDTHGNFIPRRGTVELGAYNNLTAGTYAIVGNTTFYELVCHEKNAILKFSNLPHKHFVEYKFSVFPSTVPHPASFKNESALFGPADMMTITRLIDPTLTPLSPPAPYDTIPPMNFSEIALLPNVTACFWYFDLAPGGELETNWLSLYYSLSTKRIPVPPPSSVSAWRVDSGPYYDAETPDANLGTPFGTSGSYYCVNWYVGNKFYYGFTEDANGNGRIDRLRLQAAFELLDYYPSSDPNFPGHDALEGFAVEVWDNNGTYYTVTGYERADLPRTGPAPNPANRMDCLYVFLEEKPYSDGNAILHWKIVSNVKFRDLATRGIQVGDPGDTDKTAIEEHPELTGVWDTVSPRVNYALTVPGSQRNEIYFQMSEPVVTTSPSIVVSVDSRSSTVTPPTQGSEFIIQLDAPFNVSQLAGLPMPEFHLDPSVEDFASGAIDLRNLTVLPYAYRFPPPKYPVDYDYTDYIFVQNQTYSTTGSVVIPNRIRSSAVDHRVTDVLISVPPTKLTDTQYFVWPLWAKYDNLDPENYDDTIGEIPGSGYGYMTPGTGSRPFNDTTIIWDFTGKRFLEHSDDILLQARVSGDLTVTASQLVFAFNVPDAYKASAVHGPLGLWLPDSLPPPPALTPADRFSNMVPWFYSSYAAPSMTSAGSRLFNYKFEKAWYPAGKTLVDFFFHLSDTPVNLFAGRLDIAPGDAIPANWYRLVRPFRFELHDITRQRGGVTILNNVINSEKREHVFLDYRLTKSGRVTIQVFTLDGNLVKILVRESQSAKDAYYRVSWDGTNNGGRPVARGMYFIRIVAPEIDEIRKVMVVK
jgi:hypothetical protein